MIEQHRLKSNESIKRVNFKVSEVNGVGVLFVPIFQSKQNVAFSFELKSEVLVDEFIQRD